MRFYISSLNRAKQTAKLLRHLFDFHHDIDVDLTACQQAVAAVLGYADWAELKKITNKHVEPNTSFDELLRPADLHQRLRTQASVLASLFDLNPHGAAMMVADLRATAHPAGPHYIEGPSSIIGEPSLEYRGHSPWRRDPLILRNGHFYRMSWDWNDITWVTPDIDAMTSSSDEAKSIIANTTTKIFMRVEETEITAKLSVESGDKFRAQVGSLQGHSGEAHTGPHEMKKDEAIVTWMDKQFKVETFRAFPDDKSNAVALPAPFLRSLKVGEALITQGNMVEKISAEGIESAANMDIDKVPANTANPFTSGSAESLAKLVISLLDNPDNRGIWLTRAISLFSSVIRALVWKREGGLLNLTIPLVREYMSLQRVVDLADKNVEPDMPAEVRIPIEEYLSSIPGFLKEMGGAQRQTTLDQHSFLEMQFVKILDSLADVYGHVFRLRESDSQASKFSFGKPGLYIAGDLRAIKAGDDYTVDPFGRISVLGSDIRVIPVDAANMVEFEAVVDEIGIYQKSRHGFRFMRTVNALNEQTSPCTSPDDNPSN
jgi:hypothetical protein